MQSKAEVRVGILIVSYFSADDVEGLIDSLKRHSVESQLHVAVADNSGDAVEYSRLSTLGDGHAFASFVVSKPSQNLGYGAGNNFAYSLIRSEKFDYVLVINPDVRLVKGELAEGIDSASAGRSIDFFTARTEGDIHESDGTARLSLWTSASADQSVTLDAANRGEKSRYSLTYPGGHFLGIRRSLWDALGGFDERYFLYCEEVDLLLRSPADERTITSLPRLTVSHVGGATTGSEGGSKSGLTAYHSARSRVILFRSHRRLQPFLPSVLAARLGWAAKSAVSMHLVVAGRSMAGIWSGLRTRTRPRTWSEGAADV